MSVNGDGDGSISILGICGSPREDSKSKERLKKALKFAGKFGAKTEFIDLSKLNIALCEGCYSNSPKDCKYPCIHNDDTRILHQKLKEADGFILASPVWWFGATPLVENFIAKLTSFENNGFILEGKVAGVIVSCGGEGASSSASRFLLIFNQMGIITPPYSAVMFNALTDFSSRFGKFLKFLPKERSGSHDYDDKFAKYNDLDLLAKNMVRAIKNLRGAKWNYDS